MRPALIFTLLLALVTTGCQTLPVAERPPKYRVVAYVRGRTDFARISADKLTHINYAFAKLTPQGEIFFDKPDAPDHIRQLQSLKARNPRLKVLLAVGGWGADHFSDAALTEESRERLARSAIATIKEHSLDGIDLDWEYPGQPGPGIKFRPEDKQNFTLLLATLRKHLDALSDEQKRRGHDRYALTIATAGGRYFRYTEMDKVHRLVDWVNIMTYDYYTGSSYRTGHHTALNYYVTASPIPHNSATTVKEHLKAGIPAKKLVLGVALYGRGWEGVKCGDNGLGQQFEKYAGEFSFSTLQREYIGQMGWARFWDPKANAPYLWNEFRRTFISYEDPASVGAKSKFIRSRKLGGAMYWEHSHDPDEVLLSVLAANLR